MKKAFDANVSRAKPRLRVGAAFATLGTEAEAPASSFEVEAIAAAIANEPVGGAHEAAAVGPASVIPDLSAAVKAKAAARANKPSAVEALKQALASDVATGPHAVAPSAVSAKAERVAPAELIDAPAMPPVAHAQPPAPQVEVQTAPLPQPPAETLDEPNVRRERLKERLKAVRENPRPEPLPETVAEAGVLAVERISALQTELVKVRALNLALSQDLEAARRQAERATEEARIRMDEAKRLSVEMEGRVVLLADLERELQALEGERDESLMALQESRQALDAAEREKDTLKGEIKKRDDALAESLSEEERLASELEAAHEASGNLRRSAEALREERDTLARQVSDLTRERAELLEARKALEAVHRALAHAAAR